MKKPFSRKWSNLGHEKPGEIMRKVMESHGIPIAIAQKSTKPE